MITWNIVRNTSVNDFNVEENTLQQIESHLIAAGEFWAQYFDPPNDIIITIELGLFNDQSDFLAFGGAENSTFIGASNSGRDLFQFPAPNEIATGIDPFPNVPDIFVDINIARLGNFYFDDNLTTSDDIPPFAFDAFTIFVHELAHGLGFVSFLDDFDQVINPLNDIDTFSRFVVSGADGPVFNGPNATSLFGGSVPLVSEEDFIHVDIPSDLLFPILPQGGRRFVTPLNIAILADVGVPIRSASDASDELFGFEGFADELVGLAGDDTLSGLGGDDVLVGQEGDDMLIGDEGADRLYGGSGADFISGGDGDDTASGGLGNDEIFAGGVGSGDDLFVGGAGADVIGGGDGDDLLIGGSFDDGATDQVGITGATGDGPDIIFGGAGNDTLIGGGLSDSSVDNGAYDSGEAITDGTAANTLFAGNGNDLVIGASGNDLIGGGTGDDTLEGGAGNDTFFGGQGDDGDIGTNDVIRAGAGDDVVFGSAGDDSIDGGAGNDELFNGDGDDTVNGGAGNDTIFGGSGDDVFTGGVGNDMFEFFAGNGDDIITDFDIENDIFELNGTATDFTDLASVQAAASNTTHGGQAGLLINTGGGDSVFLIGLTTDDLTSINIIF